MKTNIIFGIGNLSMSYRLSIKYNAKFQVLQKIDYEFLSPLN